MFDRKRRRRGRSRERGGGTKGEVDRRAEEGKRSDIEHLPAIETAEEIKPRTAEEVALRAIALTVVAVKAETLDQKLTLELVKRFDISSSFSPDERAFIDDPSPSERDRVHFAWRYEGLA